MILLLFRKSAAGERLPPAVQCDWKEAGGSPKPSRCCLTSYLPLRLSGSDERRLPGGRELWRRFPPAGLVSPRRNLQAEALMTGRVWTLRISLKPDVCLDADLEAANAPFRSTQRCSQRTPTSAQEMCGSSA